MDPGICYYFKGALLSSKPSDDVNSQRLKRVLELTKASPDFSVSFMQEYMPHSKINSIPADATPYRRDLSGNAFILLKWKDHTPENNLQAREIAHTLAELAPTGQGYGNYSQLPSILIYSCIIAKDILGVDADPLPTSDAVPADKAKLLFREHYPKLQGIKKKYDPDMVFNQWFTIVPA